jgi:hypothetical protein
MTRVLLRNAMPLEASVNEIESNWCIGVYAPRSELAV